tara:strand:- start:1097 stop:1756 length:660 start_codon:yes stop_codon:yes gene_type:complete
MSQQNQTKKYNAKHALKNGGPSTIESYCIKIKLAEEYVKLRNQIKEMKPVYEKADVLNKQLIQSRQDNETKLKQLTAKNKRINEMNDFIQKQDTQICQLQNDMRLQKNTSVDKADNQRLEGFLKKKDQQIKELEAQIDATKINHLEALKNKIRHQDIRLKHLSEGYAKIEEVEKDDKRTKISQLSEEIESLKKENENLKRNEYHIEDIKEKFTALYDSL